MEEVFIPGVCAGHPDHPELLWVFRLSASKKLIFDRLEIDFPEPDEDAVASFKTFDVDMRNFKGCPYCEAELYFFCKRCRSLSCFSWDQISDSHHWTCWSCKSVYRMKPKKTPFRVQAQTNNDAHAGSSRTQHTQSHTLHGHTRAGGKKGGSSTQVWHPKIKR